MKKKIKKNAIEKLKKMKMKHIKGGDIGDYDDPIQLEEVVVRPT